MLMVMAVATTSMTSPLVIVFTRHRRTPNVLGAGNPGRQQEIPHERTCKPMC